MTNISIKVSGMHCSGCSNRLSKMILGLDGVSSTDISFETGKASVEFDPSKVSVNEIQECILDAGFKVEGIN